MAQTSTQSQTVEFRIALCLSSDGAHMCQTKSNDELNADVFLDSLRGGEFLHQASVTYGFFLDVRFGFELH